MLDSAIVHTPLETHVPGADGLVAMGALWSRAMLLRADLAAGQGLKDEARIWYGRFLDLWSKADPEFAPIVARARAAYAAVGGTAPED